MTPTALIAEDEPLLSASLQAELAETWPELRIAVEYDGYEAHLDRRERDELREADLKRRGWLVIRSGSADLKDPSRLVNAVRQAFRQRGIAA